MGFTRYFDGEKGKSGVPAMTHLPWPRVTKISKQGKLFENRLQPCRSSEALLLVHSYVAYLQWECQLTLPQVAGTRSYSTTPTPKKASNLPFWLLGTGVVSAAGYWYLEHNAKTFAPKQEKSPLNPEQFTDFKLKKTEPYNHNTSKYVYCTSIVRECL